MLYCTDAVVHPFQLCVVKARLLHFLLKINLVLRLMNYKINSCKQNNEGKYQCSVKAFDTLVCFVALPSVVLFAICPSRILQNRNHEHQGTTIRNKRSIQTRSSYTP